ncbi:hypothetical protein [Bradyrhizobium sp. AZCC 2289]|uniref:hypothetical protein n=1 Tax=Bradyrhizobium sp. AZCC 2289 TaxID=3117026 RepID=UPI002FF3EA85
MMAATAEHRRHAIQIASALPNDPEDALIVLDLTRRLILEFLAEDEPAQMPGKVLTLVRGDDCA